MAYLSRLRLTNFRNLTHLDLGLSPGITVFYGPNAQGKTTLLEAVYLLCIARSFRAENEREVVNFEAAKAGEQALVDGTIEKDGQRLRVIVGYQPTQRPMQQDGGSAHNVRKEIRVNRLKRTAGELIGEVNAVLFSATDIELVQGPPSGRRRFLDILLSQADPIYLKGLQRYQRVIQQRNQLLRLLREDRAERDELAFWDGELVREGAAITKRRYEAMSEITLACGRHHQDLSGPDEDLEIEYRPSVPLPGGAIDDVAKIEDNFREALAAAVHRERVRPTTAVGPHRDDFSLMIDGADMGAFASRGQARTMALTLRLAEAEFLASFRGEGPVVLLDDALSEMDSFRRHRLLEKAMQYEQVLITTTDLDQVNDFFGSKAKYFYVSNSQIWPSTQSGNVGASPVSASMPASVSDDAARETIDESL